MSEARALYRSINGEGRPRVLVEEPTDFYTSTSNTQFHPTYVYETGGSVDYSKIIPGMRIVAVEERSGQGDLVVWGRITVVSDATDRLYVDEWMNGFPTDGSQFVVNGWVVDFPHCQKLSQTFDPEQLVHKLWRGRKASKFYGYHYTMTMDYSTHISADAIYAAGRVFNHKETDDLILIPHRDKPAVQYRVTWAGPLDIANFGIGGGHQDVVIKLQGKELVPFPADGTGYGFKYGTSYGTRL
jgi:hypothetical protein